MNIQIQDTQRNIGLLACMALSIETHSVGGKAFAAGSCSSTTELHFADRTANAIVVQKSEIEREAFDLSINRHKAIVHEKEAYGSPRVSLGRLKKLDAAITSGLEAPEAMLG